MSKKTEIQTDSKRNHKSVVLCGASNYNEKYYLNPDFSKLPKGIQEELKVMCVLFVSEVGGILTLEYEPDGTLCFRVAAEEEDILFDEIGAGLKIREYQRTKQELLEGLELYYRVAVLQEELPKEISISENK